MMRHIDVTSASLTTSYMGAPGPGARHGLAAALGHRSAPRGNTGPPLGDVDLDAGRLAVRRSVGVVNGKGAGVQLVEGPTKTGRSRVVDLDAGTVAALRAYRAARELLALDLVRDSALVLGNLDGTIGIRSGSPAVSPPR
jgi:hypothetical protein